MYGDVELSIYDRSIQVCLCNDPVSFPHPTRFDPARFGRGEFGERRANPNPNPNPAATPTPTPNPNPNPTVTLALTLTLGEHGSKLQAFDRWLGIEVMVV